MVADAGQVLDAATADEDDGMFLQVMALATYISGDFMAISQAYTGDLAQGRVRLFRRGGVDARAHAAFLRTPLQGRHRALGLLPLARFTYQLIYCCHNLSLFSLCRFWPALLPLISVNTYTHPRAGLARVQ